MMAWLTAAGTKGFARWVWIVGIAAAIAALAIGARMFITAAFDRTEQLGREAGSSAAVIAGQNQTLEQLGDANNAEQDLGAGGSVRNARRYNECLQDSRRPEACERYNPDAGQ